VDDGPSSHFQVLRQLSLKWRHLVVRMAPKSGSGSAATASRSAIACFWHPLKIRAFSRRTAIGTASRPTCRPKTRMAGFFFQRQHLHCVDRL
jgi:hypothetical protein